MACEDLCLYEPDGDNELSGYERENTTIDHEVNCCECDRPIPAATEHEYATGEFRTCLVCVAIRDGFTCDGGCCHASLWGEIEDHIFPELTTVCVAKVKMAEGRAYLLERWQKWKGLLA
jgi:hypothetical protein